MKKLLLLTLAAFLVAGIFSYRSKQEKPALLSPACYVSCATSDIRDQFREEASTLSFGAMHPNPKEIHFLPTNGQMVQFDAADGVKAQGYQILSKKKSKHWVLVIQEWWGLNDHIKNEAEKLAKDLPEANILAVDMYDGKVGATPDSAMKLVRAATTARLETIINAAIQHAGQKAKIYTIGWCFGGMWSLQASILAGKQAAGCIMFYGRPETNLEKLKTLQTEVLGFFGNKDRSPSPEIVNQFELNMKTVGKKLTTNKYEAGHGFANPSNPAFNKEATEDAYTKVIAFLKDRM